MAGIQARFTSAGAASGAPTGEIHPGRRKPMEKFDRRELAVEQIRLA
jgi:hypothetical protein